MHCASSPFPSPRFPSYGPTRVGSPYSTQSWRRIDEESRPHRLLFKNSRPQFVVPVEFCLQLIGRRAILARLAVFDCRTYPGVAGNVAIPFVFAWGALRADIPVERRQERWNPSRLGATNQSRNAMRCHNEYNTVVFRRIRIGHLVFNRRASAVAGGSPDDVDTPEDLARVRREATVRSKECF